MKRFLYILQSAVKTVHKQKVNTALIAVVMIVSMICSLFLIAYGYSMEQNSRKTRLRARIWIFYSNSADTKQLISLCGQLNESGCLFSLVACGESQTTQYTGGEETLTCVNIACELYNQKLLTTNMLGAIRFSPGDEAVITVGGPINSYVTIGGTVLKVVAEGMHEISPFMESTLPIYAYVSEASYIKMALETKAIVITLKRALSENEYDSFLSLVGEYIPVCDMIVPEITEKDSIETTQLFTAFLLLCLSFTNVYSIFLYLSQKRKKEYKVYRVCGAPRRYIIFDMMIFIVLLTGSFFAFSCLLYYLFSPLLKNVELYYPLNAYVIFTTLLLIAVPTAFVIIRLERSVKIK